MKNFIETRYLSSFYVITLIFSFFLLTLHFIFKSAGYYSISFTQLAPAFAVISIALILEDKTILEKIKSHLSLKAVNPKYLISAMLIPTTCIVASSVGLSLLDIPLITWAGSPSFYTLNIVAMLIGCCAEEIGWRGFLLPHLLEKYSPFASSIIVGFLWGIWHLNFTGGLLGFVLYTISIIEMSILMTWLFNKANGNLSLMIVWHFMFNLSSHIFLWQRFNIYLFMVEVILFGIVSLVIVITNKRNLLAKTLPL